ncbi:Putative phospholipid-transporting ATPase C24B11.12c [Psilocybe cubensis]|uniref:Phospholipid-transporting ATPase n=2 Tax=Psilocybe cubensis TaxID=181762 RepID=A0A8H7Y631_PSICU|nr:Putative phospholipid-transporting ATPase C24B11.12c [Psilocybe cubensis]KAH9484538.1 Putative phospholipid-transporting ATPase C24B11.12c [Psilocybe cubensis]
MAGSTKAGQPSLLARLAAFKLEDLFTRKRPPGPPRTVYVNQPLPQECLDPKGRVKRDHVYTTNQVITSKYTLITFIPRNLFEQFRRVANIFFLGIAVLQFFPKFSTLSAGVVILPLVIIVTVTALKDGYEDFKRHQSDRRVNYSKVFVLSGGNWTNPNRTEDKSKTFIRGILPMRSRPITTGVKSAEYDYEHSDEVDLPYWKETLWEDVRVGDFVKIMDHEAFPADILICSTSEDESVAFVETKNLDGETNLKSRRGVPALNHLNNARACADGRNSFRIQCERPDTDMYRLNGNVTIGNDTSPVDLSTTLLRGTVLKNTAWAIGVVLFTGLDSKIVMNSGGTPSKRSKVERQMNPQVIVNLIILAAMAVVCAIADSLLEVKFYPLGAPWLFEDNRSDDNPRINGLITWAFALLTFQDIVPISLYISIEVVRTCQAAFIYFDSDICYQKTGQATQARSWNLSDDLGQIQYIFSDKTGTLTQNSMVFRMCSIAGKAYRGDSDALAEDEMEDKPSSIVNEPTKETVEVDLWAASAQPSTSSHSVNASLSKKNSLMANNDETFKDSVLSSDIEAASRPNANHDSSSDASIINAFFTVLSLCHTVIAANNPETGTIEYKAQSPDESALVQAAADMGFVFLGKDKEVLSLRTPRSAEVEKYELLEILEFTSARKRMSVVLRRLDVEGSELLLLTKGADNVVFERLRPGEDEMKEETESHLSEFASTGLRTLTLAYKTIPEDEYNAWRLRYQDALNALDNREERVESVANELEQSLHLLGATAIEDRLQDGVPETIADLKKAGIKIWVATGDKLETAVAIGRSTNLISHDSNIIIVRGGSSRPVQTQMLNALAQFFPEQDYETLQQTKNEETLPEIPLRRINTGVSSIVGPENGDRPGGFILVVDGAALLEYLWKAFADDVNKGILLKLSILCDGVICCRVSPLQKALVVKLVKDGLGAMTLAIGDGANDVSMIQAADVGVGISGEEGLQAVNSSDYAIAQFRFLKKLLLVHGHWSYARNGVMILNFFYKNIVPTGILFWFQIYDGWSANYVFDYTYILFWNSLWTIAPVVGIGIFDRFLDSRILMEVPELYRYGREGTWFNLRSFLIHVLDGIVQSAIIYFITLYAYTSTSSRKDGYDVYLHEFSTTMALSGVLVANIFTGFSGTAWTWWLVFAIFIGIIIQWAFTIIYSLVSPGYAVTMLYGNYFYLFTSAYFYLAILVTFTLALTPRFMYKFWRSSFQPGDLETFQYLQKLYPHRDFSSFSRSNQPPSDLSALQRRPSRMSRRNSRASSVDTLERRFPRPSMDIRSASRTDMSTGLTSVDRGFDFATEENGVEMRRVQTNLSERRMSKQNILPRRSSSNKGKESVSNVLSLSKSILRRKGASQHRSSE